MCSGCGACAHFHCLEKTNRACPECGVPSDDPRNAPAANDQPANCINGGSSTGRAPAQHPVNFSHAAAIALPTAGALFVANGVPVPPPAIVVPTNLNAQFGASSSSSSSSSAALAQQQQASSPAAIHSFMAAGPLQHQAAAPAPPTMAMVQQMAKNMAGAMAAGVGRVIGDAIMRVMRAHRESHHNQLVVDVARELKAVAENMEAKARAIAMRAARQARAQQQQQQQRAAAAVGVEAAAAGKVGVLSQLKPPAAGAAAASGGLPCAGAAGGADWLVLTLEQAQEHARALALRAVAQRKLSSVSKDAVASAIEGLLDTGRLVVDEMDPSTYRFVGDGAAAARVMGTPPAAAAPAAAHHHHYFAQGHFVGGFATAAAQAIAVGGDGGDVEMGDAP
jgi:hypothetical protein